MSDSDTLNIETRGGKYLSLVRRPDGQIDVAIRITRRGHSLVGDCTITADRVEVITKFLKRGLPE